MKNKSTSKNLLTLLLTSTLSSTLMAPPFEGARSPVDIITSHEVSSIGVTAGKPLPDQSEIGQENAEEQQQESSSGSAVTPPETEQPITPTGDITTPGESTEKSTPGSSEQVDIPKTTAAGQNPTTGTGTVTTVEKTGPVTRQTLLQALADRLSALFEKFGFTRTGEEGTVQAPTNLTEAQKNELRVELADVSNAMDSLPKPTRDDSYSVLLNDLKSVSDQVSEKVFGVDATTLRNQVTAAPLVEEAEEELSTNTAKLLSASQHIQHAHDAYKWVGDELSAITDTEEPATQAIKTQIDIVSQELNQVLTKSITNLKQTDVAAIKDAVSKLVALSRDLLTLQNRAAGIPSEYTKVTDPNALKAQFQMAYQNLTTTRALVAQLPDSLKTTTNSIGSQLLSAAEKGMTRATNLLKQSTTPITISAI